MFFLCVKRMNSTRMAMLTVILAMVVYIGYTHQSPKETATTQYLECSGATSLQCPELLRERARLIAELRK